ncbi:thrombospondin type 3 repeat-containing protein [Snuella lapsa]|uniref:T9SS C-terminal target domain-containing protein n=1 Tax=Snuella lapsa TaxID=870481 RepID=A0ABP6WZ96_9FLAO
MKKITLLLITFFTISLSFAQTYKYHRFYSSIRNSDGTSTQIDQQVAEANCGNTYAFNELGGRYYVNIQIDTKLIPGRFYYLNFGQGYKYYYLYTSTNNEHNDEDYRLSLPYDITSICTPIDTDGDSIPDATDNCPYTPNANQLDTDGDGIGDVCENISYKYHRFYSSIRNGDGTSTQIDQQVAETNCGNTYAFNELGGRYYVNIQIDTKLIPGRFYYLNFGQGYKYYYLYTSTNNEHNDEDYRTNITHTIESICPDSDNDGVIDANDNCPNNYGTSSNGCPDSDGDGINDYDDNCPTQYGFDNGCPLADFVVESFSLTQENVGTTNAPYFELKFCATIENLGDDYGRPAKVEILLSTKNNSYDPGIVAGTGGNITLNENIAPNGGTNDYCFTHSGTQIDPIFGGRYLSQYNYVYIIIHEGSEEYSTDNNEAFYTKNISYITSKLSNKEKTLSLTEPNSTSTLKENKVKPYRFGVYNLSGQLILNETVNTIEEENNMIKNLSSGLYIVKTPSNTRKVLKE